MQQPTYSVRKADDLETCPNHSPAARLRERVWYAVIIAVMGAVPGACLWIGNHYKQWLPIIEWAMIVYASLVLFVVLAVVWSYVVGRVKK